MKKEIQNKITVSVIITTFNRPIFLEKALKSVVNQTYKNIEIIIIDDGSTIDNYKIVKKFYKEKIRINYLKLKKNSGAPYARNFGIKVSNGKYICFLDDDDEWLPEKLQKQIEKFKNIPENVALLYTGGYIKNAKGEIIETFRPAREGKVLKFLLEENFIPFSSVMIKKKCFQNTGMFDTKLYSCQDWDLWIRISSKHYEIDFVEEYLTTITKHSLPSIGTSERAITGYLQFYKKHFFLFIRNGLQNFLFKKYIELARSFYHKKKTMKMLECLFYALIADRRAFLKWVRRIRERK
ncbi:MAG: hypothetical protein B6D55_06150 [Candidatus Omnitrophica bacterium 4484_70.2]|nr:MAG: hypothetical protein B6D55_06150 [Candidatus Omnitrophica bacterium 4484_70.2]